MMKAKKNKIFSASVLTALALLSFSLVGCSQKHKPDENGMFAIDKMWFEVQDEIDEKAAVSFANKLNSLKKNFLTPQNRAFYAIVPDKSYYIPDSGYPVPNYDTAISAVNKAVQDIEYIDLTKSLSLEDYYTTDAHYKQEKLQPVLNALGEKMGFSVDISSFTQNKLEDFVGSYGKLLTKEVTAETLVYLTNDDTQNALCEVFTTKTFEKMPVYTTDKFTTKTPYDVFLNGVTPLVKIENQSSETDKELIIFRDSYASALAPLLIGEYRKITLIDLRFMASPILKDYVTFENQDVLFLYCTAIVADSALLR